jgi:hypothetical protein
MYSDHNLMFDHLLDRLDVIETRLSAREAESTELKKALIEQAEIIASLRQHAIESDANMEKLIAAVERLCERAEVPAAAPALELPFDAHLNEAMNRQTRNTPE